METEFGTAAELLEFLKLYPTTERQNINAIDALMNFLLIKKDLKIYQVNGYNTKNMEFWVREGKRT